MVIRIAASTAVLSIAAVSTGARARRRQRQAHRFDHRHRRAPARSSSTCPTPTASKTADDLRAQNLVNPEDALKYVPNLTIRKRYIGDRNALIGGRSFSTLQAPRGLVFMDGYLLSNFLGRFDAPRWNMIAPEEIERVDVLYGPFSAIYPGNSIGTTVAVRTRRPDELELERAHDGVRRELRPSTVSSDDYSGLPGVGILRRPVRQRRVVHARRESSGRDQSSDAVLHGLAKLRRGQFPAVSGAATPVTGVIVRYAIRTADGARCSAPTPARSTTRCRTSEAARRLRARPTGSKRKASSREWRNDTREREPHVHARCGRATRSGHGRVIADGVAFDVPAAALAPSTREERHVQWGTTLRTTRDTGWNGSARVLRVRHPRGLDAAGEHSRSDRCRRRSRARTPSATARAGRRSRCRACTRRATAIGPAGRTRSRSAITRTTIDSRIRSTRPRRLAQPRRRARAGRVRRDAACRRSMLQDAWRSRSAGR